MSDNVPQFGIAEYPSAPGTDTCMSCRQPAVGSYYRVNGALACARCKEQLEAQLPKDSHAAFVRGLMFGVGGAILGLILYRSEEHTSELQSRGHLVCRLLLEKKKKKRTPYHRTL